MTSSSGSPSSPDSRPRPSKRPQLATADLVQAVRDDVQELLRGELRTARSELSDTARRASRGAGLLGAAAGCAVLATGTSTVVLVRALDRVLPPTAAAVVATGLYAVAAAGLARVGLTQLREAGPLLPERTLASLKADAQAVTAAVTGTGSDR